MNTKYIVVLAFLFTLITANPISDNLSDLTSADRVKVVDLLTRKTMADDPKVYDVPIPYESMYNHIFQAYPIVDRHMSKVVSKANTVKGVNYVLHFPKLNDMYAPSPINHVINFVTSCYSEKSSVAERKRWIAILRSFDNVRINQQLIRGTTETFTARASGEQLLLWEKRDIMDDFLTQLGYTRIACGGDNGACDWARLGLPETVARNQCLYGIASSGQ